MKKQQLFEQESRTFLESPQIDRENGIIRNVKILGTTSKNNRTYMQEALNAARNLYEQKAVNINHLKDDNESDRAVEDGFGRLENIYVKEGGIFGDLAFLKSHPIADRVCEAAERMPEQFGFSHNAQGTMDGKTVTSIDHVYCVDLVRYPATNVSMFESTENIKEIDDMAIPVIVPGGSDATSAMETIKSGFQAAVMEILTSDMEVDEMKKRIGQILDAGANAVKTLNTEESVMPQTETKPAEDKAAQVPLKEHKVEVDVTDPKIESTLKEIQDALTGMKTQYDVLSKTVLLERVMREQRLDPSKLDPSHVEAIKAHETYEDMVAEAEKLPAFFRESINRSLDTFQESAPKDGGYDDLCKQLELV